MNRKPVVGSKAAIFDTGTTEIVGDHTGIAKLFKAINGAHSAPQLGKGTYTSAFSPVSQGSNICIAGAAADPTLTGGELVRLFPSKQS